MIPNDYKLAFIPALIGGIEHHAISKARVLGRHNLWKDKWDCSWWTTNALFRHQFLLTSAHYSKKIKGWRKSRGIGEDFCVAADSGGFQAATIGAKLDAAEVLYWQEKNADIIFTLDIPPVHTVKGDGPVSSVGIIDMTDAEFNDCMEETYRNNCIYRDKRTRDDTLLYMAMHGTTEERFLRWHDRMKEFKFEGVAGGWKPTADPLVQAVGLGRLWNVGIKDRIHLLGLGGKNVIPFLVYCTKYFTRLSFDSSSYGQGYMTKIYWVPPDWNKRVTFGRNFEMFDEYQNESYRWESQPFAYQGMDQLPCDCEVCREVEHPDLLAAKGSLGGALIALHNLRFIENWMQRMLAMTEEELRAYVKQTCLPKVIDAMDFIDVVCTQGYSKAVNKFYNKLPEDIMPPKQMSLF